MFQSKNIISEQNHNMFMNMENNVDLTKKK